MSYNRGKKWGKKSKNFTNRKSNFQERNLENKLKELFGGHEGLYYESNENQTSEERIKIISEGEKLWEKKFSHMMKNKNKINSFLNYIKHNPTVVNGSEVLNQIIHREFFLPYELYGNKTKSWFPDFYEWVSKFNYVPKGNEFYQFFRVMEKSEFLEMLKNGVQGISWSPYVSNSPMWIKKHFLSKPGSENDKMVVVGGLFQPEGLIFHCSRGSNSKDENEVWVRKGYKPLNIFTLGEYSYDDLMTHYNRNKVENNISELRKYYSTTNGFIGHNTKYHKILKKPINFFGLFKSSSPIKEKLFKVEIPKYVRKFKKCSTVKKYQKLNSTSVEIFLEKHFTSLNNLVKFSEEINPTISI